MKQKQRQCTNNRPLGVQTNNTYSFLRKRVLRACSRFRSFASSVRPLPWAPALAPPWVAALLLLLPRVAAARAGRLPLPLPLLRPRPPLPLLLLSSSSSSSSEWSGASWSMESVADTKARARGVGFLTRLPAEGASPSAPPAVAAAFSAAAVFVPDLLLPAWSRLLLREPAAAAVDTFPRRRPLPLRGEPSTSAALVVVVVVALSSDKEPRDGRASLRLLVRAPQVFPPPSPSTSRDGGRRSASLPSATKSLPPSSEDPADVTEFAAAHRCRPRFRFSVEGNEDFLAT